MRVKSGGEAVVTAGEKPILVLGTYGKGRVAVFAGTVLGEPDEGTLPFWEWDHWPTLLGRTLQWLAGAPVGAKPQADEVVPALPDIPIAAVETFSNRIVRLEPDGTRTVLGRHGTGRGEFWWPTDLAVDSSGKLIVVDHFNHRIVRTDWQGQTWETLATPFYSLGLALDREDRIHLSHSYHVLARFDDMTGKGWIELGSQRDAGTGPSPAPGGLCHATGLDFDSQGRLYISNNLHTSNVVRVDDLSGAGWKLLSYQVPPLKQHNVEYPAGLAVDREGRIHIADCTTDRVVRMDDMDGNGFTALEGFSFPLGLSIDKQGRIWVADTGNDRIVRIDDITGEGWTEFTGFDGPHQVIPLD